MESNNINTFKNRLDNFWKDQPILFDFKANITGAGNMSLENLKLDLTIALGLEACGKNFLLYPIVLKPIVPVLLNTVRNRALPSVTARRRELPHVAKRYHA